MNGTRIFVSSTCYDLAPVREDVRNMILEMGHEPIMSDYPSFPVNPDETAVGNCRRNVREHSDILVLIVGGRRGSLDSDTQRPVTNLEYEEAVQCGIPVYVFIRQSVQTLLRVWKKNPEADFTTDVDYPEVFKFIAAIQAKGTWTFAFERTEEIKGVLRVQLSGLFRDLLDRRRGGRLTPLPEFSQESQRARFLALNKPKFWEYLLTADLLKSKLASARKRHNEVKNGLIHMRLESLRASEVLNWVPLRISELSSLLECLRLAMENVTSSWGLPGQPADAIEIKTAADRLAQYAEEIVDWEISVLRVRPPDHLAKLVTSVSHLSGGIIEKLELIPEGIAQFFIEHPDGEGQIVIKVVFDLPPMDDLYAETDRLRGVKGAFDD